MGRGQAGKFTVDEFRNGSVRRMHLNKRHRGIVSQPRGQARVGKIRANGGIWIALKAAFVLLAVAGVATLWMAVLADTGASALVVANAVRLRRFT